MTISGGVLAGTKNAYHPDTSKPGRPASAIVGTSGTAGARFADVTRQRTHLALLHERHHRGDVVEEQVDAPGDEVLDRGRGAAIGDMHEIEAGRALEQLGGEMGRGAMAGRRKA